MSVWDGSDMRVRYAKELGDALKRRLAELDELRKRLAALAESAKKEADGLAIQSYEEGFAVGKQIAYTEAAAALGRILDGG